MTPPDPVVEPQWVQCTTTFIKALPVLELPFDTLPNIYAPEKTLLQMKDGSEVYAFKWCYLNRRGGSLKTLIDTRSLSTERVRAMPRALTRLSKWFRFKDSRARSVQRSLHHLGSMLDWADQIQQGGRFEGILSDPDLALEALKGYHTYLRSRLQAHQISSSTAGASDKDAIACLSEIHSKVFKNYIEPLESGRGPGTNAPDSESVAEFGSTLQAIFDSVAVLFRQGNLEASVRAVRTRASDDTKSVLLAENYGPLRLMELACVVYAGLVCMDSGANLSVLAQYEEPEDLDEQLADPDRINLREKVIKFRAGGKAVDVFLTSTTVTRLKVYLEIRQRLIATLGCDDIAPLLIQCEYPKPRSEPIAVRALDRAFLRCLRDRTARLGTTLPAVTLRQLRVYAQQRFATTVPLPIAAKRMGHTVQTAIRAYCKAQAATHRGELTQFLRSLEKTVLEARGDRRGTEHQTIEQIPTGACTDYGAPAPVISISAVEPDCLKSEGCFFCRNYRVHADENDMRKLMSCRRVLSAITPINADSIRAHKVYSAVVDRIDALLRELKRRQPRAYEAIRVDVEQRGQLTGYWARKLQQLHLLGMLPANSVAAG